MFSNQILKDRVALVTGGGRGIGKAITEQLAREGADVIFCYHSSSEKALAFQKEMQAQDLKVTAIQMDVRDKAQVDATIEDIINTKEKIDILVNNSGIVRDNLLMAFSPEEIKDVFDTNILGMFNVTQAVTPFMMRKRSGKIINMSSVAGNFPGRGHSNYAATKGAVNSFTKAIAVELASRKIQVNAIAPGVIETDISQEVRDLASDEILSKILVKRFGKPEEVAQLAAFLASPYSDYINGQILHIDGGLKWLEAHHE